MNLPRGSRALGVLLVASVAVAACGNGPTSPAPTSSAAARSTRVAESPVEAAYAYFRAYDSLDLAALNARSAPERRPAAWAPDGAPPPDFFGDVTCQLGSQTESEATVDCLVTFKEGWSGFVGGRGPWNLRFRREAPAGRWLVFDWGVG